MWRKGRGGFSSRFPALLLALAVLAAGISFGAPSLRAQEAEENVERPWLLKRIFPQRQENRLDPGVEVIRPGADVAKPRAKKKKTRIVREDVNPQATVVVKRPDARVVLVVGDFLGSGLAEGLTTVFTQNPRVRVVDRTNGSSGFVRDDFYNWPQKIGELIDRERPAVILVMLGANDRQQMQVGNVAETLRSENWTKEYSARTQALAKAISDKKVPFLWVGVPAFKSSRMLLDMLAFNDVYRAAAASAGAEFVDIWDGFVDENGAYMSNGPDINGQPARLRAADGINLARPGKRKVAFYAEKPLYRLLGETPLAPGPGMASSAMEPPPFASPPMGMAEATVPAVDLDVVVDPSEIGPIDPARPVSLRSPAIDGGTELLGLVAEPRHDARTPGEKLAIEGIAPAALPGRADDFSWPSTATSLASAAAMPDATSAKSFVPAVLPKPVNFVSPPKSPPAEKLIPPPAPLQEAVPTVLPARIIPYLAPKVVPSEVVFVAAIPAGFETTKSKSLVAESVVGGPRDIPAVTIAPRSPAKLPKTSGPDAEAAPTMLQDRIEDLLVLQAAPTEIVPLPATLTPAEVEVMAAKGAASESLTGPMSDASPMRLVPRRAVKLPASIGPEAAEAVPTTPSSPAAVDFSPQRIVPAETAPAPAVAIPAGKDTPLAPPPDGTEALAMPAAAPESGTAQPEPASDVSPASAAPAASSVPQAEPVGTAPTEQAQPPAPAAPTVLPEAADVGSSTEAAPSAPAPAPPPALPALSD